MIDIKWNPVNSWSFQAARATMTADSHTHLDAWSPFHVLNHMEPKASCWMIHDSNLLDVSRCIWMYILQRCLVPVAMGEITVGRDTLEAQECQQVVEVQEHEAWPIHSWRAFSSATPTLEPLEEMQRPPRRPGSLSMCWYILYIELPSRGQMLSMLVTVKPGASSKAKRCFGIFGPNSQLCVLFALLTPELFLVLSLALMLGGLPTKTKTTFL